MLATNSNHSSKNITTIYYQHYRKLGHSRDQCFQLKTCNKCSKRRHIAKFCKEELSSHITEISSAEGNIQLPASPRMILKVKICDRVCMTPYRCIRCYLEIFFDKLPTQPGLMNVNRKGLGVSQQPYFAYLNLELESSNS